MLPGVDTLQLFGISRTLVSTFTPGISFGRREAPPLMECPYSHRHLYRSCGGRSVESEGRREVPVSVDLRLQIGDLLHRGGNGIGAGDKPARR